MYKGFSLLELILDRTDHKTQTIMYLSLTKHHPIKTYLGGGATAPRIHLGTRRWWVVRFTPRPFYSWEKNLPPTHWIGGWGLEAGSRAGLDAVGIEPLNLDRPGRSQLLYIEAIQLNILSCLFSWQCSRYINMCMGLGPLEYWISGSNPAGGIDVCLYFFLLCCLE
jgi:hypothetical protein